MEYLSNDRAIAWYTRWAIIVPPEGDVELLQLPEIHSKNPKRTLSDTGKEFSKHRFIPPNSTIYFFAIHTPAHEDASRLTDPGSLLPTDDVYTDVIEIIPLRR